MLACFITYFLPSSSDPSIVSFHSSHLSLSNLCDGHSLSPYEDVWLLERLRSFLYDCTNNVPFFCHIRTAVGSFVVGTKIPNAPSATCGHWYLLAIYHLASLDPSLIPITFFSWDLISYQHMVDTQSYTLAPHFHYHCPPNFLMNSNSTSLSSKHHPPAVISLRSQRPPATPETFDTGSRPFDTGSLIPHSLLPALSNAKPSHQSQIPNVGIPNQHPLHPARPVVTSTPMQQTPTNKSSPLPASTQPTSPPLALPIATLFQPTASLTNQTRTTQTRTTHSSFASSTQTTAVTVSTPRPPTLASTSPNSRGNRYEFIFGYPTPPEMSGKPAVISFLQQIFPCPHGG
jgi:hypothetical protein